MKFGALRGPDGSCGGIDTRPAAVKNFLVLYARSGWATEYIDIYRPARLDPAVPIEDTIGAIADMVRAGYVRHIGFPKSARRRSAARRRTHPICDLQIEYSLMSRGIEYAILPVTRELGIAITAYGVLSRGILSGRVPSADSKGDIRVIRMPRYAQGNLEKNLSLVETLAQIGKEKNATPAPACHRLGALARVRYRAGDRRAPPRPACGKPGRACIVADDRRSRAHRCRGVAGAYVGRTL